MNVIFPFPRRFGLHCDDSRSRGRNAGRNDVADNCALSGLFRLGYHSFVRSAMADFLVYGRTLTAAEKVDAGELCLL